MAISLLSPSDSFFAGPRRGVIPSVGKPLLPCHFRQVHYCVALFRTSHAALDKIFSGTGLIPALRWGSQNMIALGLIRYTDSDLGAYDEVILSVPSVPADGKKPLFVITEKSFSLFLVKGELAGSNSLRR